MCVRALAVMRARIIAVTGYSSFSIAFVQNARYASVMRLFDAECPLRDIVPYLVRPSPAVATPLNALRKRVSARELIALQARQCFFVFARD
jgi:hypothetical protein